MDLRTPRVRALLGATVGTVLIATVAVLPAPASAAPPQHAAASIPGRIVVAWDDDASATARAAARGRHGSTLLERFPGAGVEVLRVPEHAKEGVIAALNADPSVDFAEPDYVMAAGTDDPYSRYLWGLHNTGQTGGTSDIDIDAPEAWQSGRGSSDVVVAVIDTGIDINHPDLVGNVWTNTDEIAGNGIDDDRNGYVDDVNGWDFAHGDNSVFDSSSEDGHGTHVAGTIAARADNRIGIAGVAPNVKIMPLKFLSGAEGSGSSSTAAAAVAYAYANGATVINASWGGGGGTALRNAINAAPRAVVVAAAGNEGVDIDTSGGYFPASWAKDSYAMPNIVSVAAVDHAGSRPSFSNYGVASVDVGAPGRSIYSTVPGGYGTASGTSMAAPHVAGIAALVLSAQRTLDGGQVVSALKAGTQPLSSLAGVTTTGGLVNAPATLSRAAATTPPTTTTTTTAPTTTSGGGSAPAPEPEPEPDPLPDPIESSPEPYDGDGARSLDWACPGITISGFTDVATGTTHAAGVGCAGAWGVFTGSSDGLFRPLTQLSRGQLASVLARAIEQATGAPLPAGADHFDDDDGTTHEAAINKLAELGIVTGFDATTYGSSAPVTRAQFATMLARTYRHLAGSLPAGTDAFNDDDSSPHESAINGLVAIGVIAGTGGGQYQPNTTLVRGQSATLVARLLDALVEAGVASRPA